MNRWKLFVALPVALFVLVGFTAGAFAGTTGKLTGRVMDAASGEPLPGVNIVIEGTRRGAQTDADGFYLILSVDPGNLTLVASMVGYNAVSQTDVLIHADFTSTVDFQLKETALEAEELVVIAERPPVEPDKTTSHYVMGAEQLESLPHGAFGHRPGRVESGRGTDQRQRHPGRGLERRYPNSGRRGPAEQRRLRPPVHRPLQDRGAGNHGDFRRRERGIRQPGVGRRFHHHERRRTRLPRLGRFPLYAPKPEALGFQSLRERVSP